jgi:hypothetical protein
MKPRSPRTKTMRVATALTGMTACAAAFTPAATAQAGTQGHPTAPPGFKVVVLGPAGTTGLRAQTSGHTAGAAVPDGSVPNLHYSLGVTLHGISQFHVCGYHVDNAYRCTPEYTGYNKGLDYLVYRVGGNIRSWQRGQTTVYWNNGGAGNWDTCNTNGDYNGYAGYFNSPNALILSPNYVWLTTVGPGDPTC